MAHAAVGDSEGEDTELDSGREQRRVRVLVGGLDGDTGVDSEEKQGGRRMDRWMTTQAL